MRSLQELWLEDRPVARKHRQPLLPFVMVTQGQDGLGLGPSIASIYAVTSRDLGRSDPRA